MRLNILLNLVKPFRKRATGLGQGDLEVLGSKRTGKMKRWESEGRISSTAEPPVDAYFKGSFSSSGRKTEESETVAALSHTAPVHHLDFSNQTVLDQCLKILKHLETNDAILPHETVFALIGQPTGIKTKSAKKRIKEMVNENLLVTKRHYNGVSFALSDSGREFLKNPEDWIAKRKEKIDGIDEMTFRMVLSVAEKMRKAELRRKSQEANERKRTKGKRQKESNPMARKTMDQVERNERNAVQGKRTPPASKRKETYY